VANEIIDVPQVDGVQLTKIDAHTLEAEMARTHDLNSLFSALSARGVVVTSMRNKANRLEELFVRLVDNNKGDATVAKAGLA
jgi:ABC-2 type transport system ATP-binding protein